MRSFLSTSHITLSKCCSDFYRLWDDDRNPIFDGSILQRFIVAFECTNLLLLIMYSRWAITHSASEFGWSTCSPRCPNPFLPFESEVPKEAFRWTVQNTVMCGYCLLRDCHNSWLLHAATYKALYDGSDCLFVGRGMMPIIAVGFKL